MKLEIIDYSHEGKGVAKLDGFAFFIPNTKIGEVHEVTNVVKKKKFGFAEAINVENKTDCPVYFECGGCQILHLTYEEQLEFKKNSIMALVNKNKLDIEIADVIKCDNNYGYRNKVTLHNLGFKKSKSSEIVSFEKCLLISEKMNSIIAEQKGNYIDTLVIHENTFGDIMISSKDKISSKIANTIYHNNEKVTGEDFYMYLGEVKYKILPTTFFQVNSHQSIKLFDIVRENIKNDVVLDGYCGVGAISLYIADKAKKVYGLEINSESIKMANENQVLNNITNVEFMCSDVKAKIAEFTFVDTIILDPPRTGCDKEVIDIINNSNIKKIIYISCNPATLIRDIQLFDFNTSKITPVDMFPNTYHIESVTVLERP